MTLLAEPIVDLSDVMPQSTGVLHIVVPGTNKRTGWQVTFAGPSHPKTIAQNEELSRASLDKAERIEMAQVNNRKWKGEGKQPDDVRRENVEWVLGRILSWKAVVRAGAARRCRIGWSDDPTVLRQADRVSRGRHAGADQAGSLAARAALYAAVLPADVGVSGRPGVFYRSLRQDLRAFAERHFALIAPVEGDQTYRDLLEGLVARSKNPARLAEYRAELECPPFPRALSYLWRTFQRLRNRRTSNGFGVNPITWVDLGEFTRLTGVRLAPWEIEVIEELDILDRNEIAKAMKKKD
jgi:hypothetical protein